MSDYLSYGGKYKGIFEFSMLKNPKKYCGKEAIVYRSALEFDYIKIWDNNKNILEWESEPSVFKVPYINPLKEGRLSNYYIDFYIKMKDKNEKEVFMLIEAKPQSMIDDVINLHKLKQNSKKFLRAVLNRAKWDNAILFCKDLSEKRKENWQFILLSEKDLQVFKG